MSQLDTVKKHLREGNVYRRSDLAKWSKSVDRHLQALLDDGTLEKLAQGLYYYPKMSVFGKTPPAEDTLIKSFLNDNRFLVTTPNAYNALGVGTTQLYNSRTVYNHKRHGDFHLGNNLFSFKIKPHFPSRLTLEFLMVDLVNNLDDLAEDTDQVLNQVIVKVKTMDRVKLKSAVTKYGNVKTKKFFNSMFQNLAA